MLKKGFILLPLLGIIVLIIFIVGGYFFYRSKTTGIDYTNTFLETVNGNQSKLSSVVFSEHSSLPDGQKIGVWNAPDVDIVTSLSDAPKDGTSYLDFSQFDSTVKNLGMSQGDVEKIKELSKQAVSDLFVGADRKKENFITQHFSVVKVSLGFSTDVPYKEQYTLEDGDIRLTILYKFSYDWYTTDDSIVFAGPNGESGFATQGPSLAIRWISGMNGAYIKSSQPTILPLFNTRIMNNNPYEVFKKGFDNILSKKRVEEIISNTVPNADTRRVQYLELHGQNIFYPAIVFMNSANQKTAFCKGSTSPNIKYQYRTCNLNGSTGDVSCKDYDGTCVEYIFL